MATVDQVGKGRAGLNVVAGWNKPEYDTFGIELPQDHDDRYAYAQEWFDIVKKIWTTEGIFDWNGKFFQLEHVEGLPKPFDGMIPILNAGSSAQGREFAARNANFVFTIVGGPDDGAEVVKTVTTQAKDEYHRDAGVFTLGYCVVRPTEKEAKDFLHYYAEENADWGAVDNLMTLQGMHAQSFTPEMLSMFRERFAGGHGSCPIIGSPDQVADEIERFSKAGFGGMTLSFFDYAGELPYFAEEVIARNLARASIRQVVLLRAIAKGDSANAVIAQYGACSSLSGDHAAVGVAGGCSKVAGDPRLAVLPHAVVGHERTVMGAFHRHVSEGARDG